MEKIKKKENIAYDIIWPKLTIGTLIRRYQRFMADVRLGNRHIVTAYCPNTGSMQECSEAGRTVFLSRNGAKHRKLKYTWEMIEMPTSLVGINTILPNKLVRSSVMKGLIPGLKEFESLRTEVSYGRGSRIDILLEKGMHKTFIEVKNCTLVQDGTAFFPDAVSTRGLKHLKELQEEVKKGNRGIMFYLIQRMDASLFKPAYHIDPLYGKELKKALENGVEIMVYDVILDKKGICINRAISYEI
jgi:sugar fermentation stimulation protein A